MVFPGREGGGEFLGPRFPRSKFFHHVTRENIHGRGFPNFNTNFCIAGYPGCNFIGGMCNCEIRKIFLGCRVKDELLVQNVKPSRDTLNFEFPISILKLYNFIRPGYWDLGHPCRIFTNSPSQHFFLTHIFMDPEISRPPPDLNDMID